MDLEEFFRLGGTLELIAPADSDDEDFSNDPIADFKLGKHDLIISEIMWALDIDIDGDTATANDRRQWIEIYAAKALGHRQHQVVLLRSICAQYR